MKKEKSNNYKQLPEYWAPLSKIITESMLLRESKCMTQYELAYKMNTKQSVISRFENMGRIPNYDFISRLSLSLGHIPGMTLYGDFMAIVPLEKQSFISEIATHEKITTKKLVQNILDQGIIEKTNNYYTTQKNLPKTTDDYIDSINTFGQINDNANEPYQLKECPNNLKLAA